MDYICNRFVLKLTHHLNKYDDPSHKHGCLSIRYSKSDVKIWFCLLTAHLPKWNIFEKFKNVESTYLKTRTKIEPPPYLVYNTKKAKLKNVKCVLSPSSTSMPLSDIWKLVVTLATTIAFALREVYGPPRRIDAVEHSLRATSD